MEIIKKFIQANPSFVLASPKVTIENLTEIEVFTNTPLIPEFKDFISQLSSLQFKSDDDIVNTTLTPFVHEICIKKVHKANDGVGLFGFQSSDIETIGVPIIELSDVEQYKEYIEAFNWEECSLDGKEGRMSDFYPCPLIDVYGDGHQLICIDYKGRVVSWNYECDEDDVTILANDQSEFLNNLFIDSEPNEDSALLF